jgi:hypothetical protein
MLTQIAIDDNISQEKRLMEIKKDICYDMEYVDEQRICE